MREIADDFQKLIAGNAPFKMVVGPLTANSMVYLKDMKTLANYDHAAGLYFLLLPHPGDWASDVLEEGLLYEWAGSDWQEVNR